MNFVHLNYHFHEEFNLPPQVIEKHKLSSGFVDYLKHKVKFTSVKHLNYEGNEEANGVSYFFFKSRNRSWYIPFKTHRFIKKVKPDIILVEGFVFPLQVIFLKWTVGKNCRIILQHHGEKPFKGLKKFFQKIADRYIDAYTFTSVGNAMPWVEENIIANENKCREVLSASTDIKPLNKQECRRNLGLIDGEQIFLWVGRLNQNKDPLTMLKAFEKYLEAGAHASLYMIFQTDELLNDIVTHSDKKPLLKKAVKLLGKKEKVELAEWYSAADFYISGSHSEGSGYALVEAMTCGCIPIVTNIPSFRKITQAGNYGLHFEPGNSTDLLKELLQLNKVDKINLSATIKKYTAEELSTEAIANQFYSLTEELLQEKLLVMNVRPEPELQ